MSIKIKWILKILIKCKFFQDLEVQEVQILMDLDSVDLDQISEVDRVLVEVQEVQTLVDKKDLEDLGTVQIISEVEEDGEDLPEELDSSIFYILKILQICTTLFYKVYTSLLVLKEQHCALFPISMLFHVYRPKHRS